MSISAILTGRLLVEKLAEWRAAINLLLAPPMATLRRAAAQTIATNTYTVIAYDTEVLDTAGYHSTVTNPSRYTPLRAGKYQVSGVAAFATNSTGLRAASFYKNGTILDGSETKLGAMATLPTALPLPTIHVDMNGTTDYLEMAVFQNTGGNLNTSTEAPNAPSMYVRWVSE